MQRLLGDVVKTLELYTVAILLKRSIKNGTGVRSMYYARLIVALSEAITGFFATLGIMS